MHLAGLARNRAWRPVAAGVIGWGWRQRRAGCGVCCGWLGHGALSRAGTESLRTVAGSLLLSRAAGTAGRCFPMSGLNLHLKSKTGNPFLEIRVIGGGWAGVPSQTLPGAAVYHARAPGLRRGTSRPAWDHRAQRKRHPPSRGRVPRQVFRGIRDAGGRNAVFTPWEWTIRRSMNGMNGL